MTEELFDRLYQELDTERKHWNSNWKEQGLYRHEPDSGEDLGNVCGLGAKPGYLFLFEYLVTKKPRVVLEYGPGVSTYFMNRVIEECNLPTKVIAFENDLQYYTQIQSAGTMDKWQSIRLVPMLLEHVMDNHERPFSTAQYVHDYDSLEKVDLIIIDGPHVNRYGVTITNNISKFVDYWGFYPDLYFDERVPTREYYEKKKAIFEKEFPDRRSGEIFYPRAGAVGTSKDDTEGSRG